MLIIVLGGIYAKVMTPAEAASVAVLYSIPAGFFIYKGLNRGNFLSVLIETATMTGVIMLMLYAVMILSYLYIMENVPQQIIMLLTSIMDNITPPTAPLLG